MVTASTVMWHCADKLFVIEIECYQPRTAAELEAFDVLQMYNKAGPYTMSRIIVYRIKLYVS